MPDNPEFDWSEGFDAGGWQIVGTYRNPWGKVPVTAGGESLHGASRAYMDRLLAAQRGPDPVSRRHHYVPRTYVKGWSFDGRRVWNLDTVTGQGRALSVNDVCVEEDFYRVVGPDGEAHNRVEECSRSWTLSCAASKIFSTGLRTQISSSSTTSLGWV